jgi:hypothetical protein
VPKLCPQGAFLTVLALVTECGMSNLQILRIAWEFKSPSPHQGFYNSQDRAHPGAVISVVELVFRAVSIFVSLLDCFLGVDINDSGAAINVVSTFFYF